MNKRTNSLIEDKTPLTYIRRAWLFWLDMTVTVGAIYLAYITMLWIGDIFAILLGVDQRLPR